MTEQNVTLLPLPRLNSIHDSLDQGGVRVLVEVGSVEVLWVLGSSLVVVGSLLEGEVEGVCYELGRRVDVKLVLLGSEKEGASDCLRRVRRGGDG